MVPRETEGPDRCRGSLLCQQYHDHPIDPAELTGSLSNCCCCNPCYFIRPDTIGDGGGIGPRGGDVLIQFDHCCRCVPRGIYAYFIPDDPDNACCVTSAVPMFHIGVEGGDTNQEIYSVYSGSLYGYSIQVHLGRLLLSGYGYGYGYEYGYDPTTCAWRIHVTKYGVDLTEEIAIDNDEITCLSVPAFEVLGVEGPAGCTGKIVLGNFDKARLPYRAIEAVWDFPYGYDYEGYPQAKFVELDPSCGYGYGYEYGYGYGYIEPCEQVCSRICVHGQRYLGGVHERVEFEWFEETGEDYYGPTLTRGWKRYNSTLEITEYIYLEEDDEGRCILRADMPQELPTVVIDMDRGCGCRLNELFWRDFGDESVAFTIRCGFCSCWEFFCGTCRCMPTQLCVMSFIDGVFNPRTILTWDDETRCWEDLSYGYGAGGVRICLGADGGDCVLTLFVDGEDAGIDPPPVLDCGDEMLDRVFAPSNDVFNVTFAKSDEYGYLWVLASSLIQDCVVGPCFEATPCNEECGGHPASLTVHLHAWNDIYEDEPYIEGECSLEIEVYYWESWWWTGLEMEPHCGYIGFDYRMCDDPPYLVVTRVEVKNGVVSVERIAGGAGLLEVPFVVEECNPYFADTGVIVTGLRECEWGCPEQTQRYQITVTE